MSSALSRYSGNYAQSKNSVTTPLPNQVPNSTGGFVFQVGPKERLERFLILGTDGGTYYTSEKDLTKQNVDWLISQIKSDPDLVLNTVLDVSTNGRAFKQNPAIFAMALLVIHAENEPVKTAAVNRVADVCRTATALYQYAQFVEDLSGWGRAKRRSVSNWFTSKSPENLAYQAVKYRQRNGWTLRDLMRLSHPVGLNQTVGNFILGKEYFTSEDSILRGFKLMQGVTSVDGVVNTLKMFPNLPWETIPTQFLKNPEVWKTLFYNGQLKGQALVRNVVRLAKIDAFNDIRFAGDYAKALTNSDMILKTRLHPIQYLMASITYSEGQHVGNDNGWGRPRTKSWNENVKIAQALQAGFHESFKSVQPANARTMIGVDVSGSMGWGSCAGSDLTPAQAAAAMAMVTARVEPYTAVYGFANTLRDLQISPSSSFSEIMKKTDINNFGSTNPGLLMEHASKNGIEVDTFIVITDNEVNSGSHPSTLLKQYRDKTGFNAKLVVMGMTATDFTIADPSDRGMMDVCGFDSNAPKVVSDFSAGRL